MIETSGKTSLGMPNLLESRFALPKPWVLGMLTFEYYYAVLIPSHDPSQNLGVANNEGPYETLVIENTN